VKIGNAIRAQRHIDRARAQVIGSGLSEIHKNSPGVFYFLLQTAVETVADPAVAGPTRQGATLMSRIRRFIRDETAATSIEYALIAAGISIVIVAAVNAIGGSLNTTFTQVSTALGSK
jgi:pilus assembly protein Flp/PilA